MKFSFSIFLFLAAFSLSAQKIDQTPAPADSNALKNSDTLLLEDQDLLKASDKSTDSAKLSQTIIETDEELILDGEEEYLITPANPEKESISISKTRDSSIVKSPQSDTLIQATSAVDSTSNQVKPVNQLPRPEQVVVPATPAKIENMQSINFAKNLKQYRSPKLAMLFSFIMPGAGQIYARHKTKAAIFGAVEAAIIGTGVGFAVKGKKDMKKARKFADENYSIDTFVYYYDSVFSSGVSDSIIQSYFTEPSAKEFLDIAKNRDDDFYDLIRGTDRPYVRGWKDIYPHILPGFTIPEGEGYKSDSTEPYLVYPANDDSAAAAFGFSKLQKEFESKFSDANNFLDISQKVFFLLILDRIVSAVDAGITAKAYNDEMLGKQSLWQRVNIREKQVNTGSGVYSGYAFELRF